MTRRALVTGSGRGLGAEFARQLAEAGWQVIPASRAEGLDLAAPKAIERFAAGISGPIDLLIHNAAIRGAVGGLARQSAEDFLQVMAVNVLGPLLLTRALLDRLRGPLVVVSSRAGSMGESRGNDGDHAYRASKAALNMAFLSLGEEIGRPVLMLHPGWAQTDMGGPDADLPVAQSVAGMLTLIAEGATGFRAWDGTPIAW